MHDKYLNYTNGKEHFSINFINCISHGWMPKSRKKVIKTMMNNRRSVEWVSKISHLLSLLFHVNSFHCRCFPTHFSFFIFAFRFVFSIGKILCNYHFPSTFFWTKENWIHIHSFSRHFASININIFQSFFKHFSLIDRALDRRHFHRNIRLHVETITNYSID